MKKILINEKEYKRDKKKHLEDIKLIQENIYLSEKDKKNLISSIKITVREIKKAILVKKVKLFFYITVPLLIVISFIIFPADKVIGTLVILAILLLIVYKFLTFIGILD